MAERTSREFQEIHVAACEASGETRVAYCRRVGLSLWTFRNGWRALRPVTARRPMRGATQSLVPLMVQAHPPAATLLELRVGGQVSLSVPASVDAAWLGAVLRAAAAC